MPPDPAVDVVGMAMDAVDTEKLRALMERCMALGTGVGEFDGSNFWLHGWASVVAFVGTVGEDVDRPMRMVRIQLAPFTEAFARGVGNFASAFCSKVAGALQ